MITGATHRENVVIYAGLLAIFLTPLITVAVISMGDTGNAYSGSMVASALDVARRNTTAFVAGLDARADILDAVKSERHGGADRSARTILFNNVLPEAGRAMPDYQHVRETGTGTWSINIASMASRQRADKYVEYILARGINAQLKHVSIKGNQYWRIFVNGFHSLEEAESSAMTIKDRLGLQEVWFSREPDHSLSFAAGT